MVESIQITSALTYEQVNDLRYDVIIFDKATKEIVKIAAENLPTFREGEPCASDTYVTESVKLNRNYDIDIVPAGEFKKGDIYK